MFINLNGYIGKQRGMENESLNYLCPVPTQDAIPAAAFHDYFCLLTSTPQPKSLPLTGCPSRNKISIQDDASLKQNLQKSFFYTDITNSISLSC